MVWKIIEPSSKTFRHYRGLPFGSPNTAYTPHFVLPNFGYAKTSYMLEMKQRYMKLGLAAIRF